MKFCLPYGRMLMKTKIHKIGLEIWWIGTCHQNLVSIHLTVSEKKVSTDGRTTNGQWTIEDGHPCHDSSAVVQWHKAELK